MEACEFCNLEKDTEPTSMVGCYCIDCHRLVIDESKDAIKKLQGRKGGIRKRVGSITKDQYDNALDALMHSPEGK